MCQYTKGTYYLKLNTSTLYPPPFPFILLNLYTLIPFSLRVDNLFLFVKYFGWG